MRIRPTRRATPQPVRAAAFGAAGAGAFACAMVGAVALASPAGATIDVNQINCQGSAVITPKGGAPETIQATQAKAHIPRESSAPVVYQGSTSPVSHHHHGAITLQVGFSDVTIYHWASANDGNKPADGGTAKYPSQLKNAPPGIYHVSGFHQADEGRCSGHMDLIVDGSPLSSPAGAGAAAGTVVTGAAVAAAGLRKGKLKGTR